MKMTQKLIEVAYRLAPKGGGDDETARAVAKLLDGWNKLAASVAKLREEAAKLKAEAEKKQRENEAAIEALRRTCLHPSTTGRDAGIYADFYNECDVCGANTRPKHEQGLDRR